MENDAQKVAKENAYAQDNFSFILYEPPHDVVLDQAPAAAFLPLNYFIVDDRVGPLRETRIYYRVLERKCR